METPAETSAAKAKRTRRPNARPTEIILGAIDERLQMISDSPHFGRLTELHDELRRSLSKQQESVGTEE